jgi:hypothetical protein
VNTFKDGLFGGNDHAGAGLMLTRMAEVRPGFYPWRTSENPWTQDMRRLSPVSLRLRLECSKRAQQWDKKCVLWHGMDVHIDAGVAIMLLGRRLCREWV